MVDPLKRSFFQPSHVYTPIPFWFWNDELKKEEILRQIDQFEKQEVKGFVIHPRMGIPRSMPYLSDEFMEIVKFAVEEAAKRGMQVILYDEGMYPSGAANGLVVKENPEYASRGLEMKEFACNGKTDILIELKEGERLVSIQAVKKTGEDHIDYEATRVLEHEGEKQITFQPPDEGLWSVLLFVDTHSMGTIRGIHEGQDDREPDAPRAADLLNKEATQVFIEKTHERYYAWLKPHFGKTIIAMFTDEPDMLGRGHRRGLKPWTKDFLNEMLNAGMREEDLAVLWLQAGRETELIRRKYDDAVRRRLMESYYKPLSDWCQNHGIALTGHPAASDDIGLLEHFHIPGQDVVWRFIAPDEGTSLVGRHSTMGKCSSDAARHRSRPRNLNECFGVCGKNKGWDLTIDEMKWYLDWLLVRGVNMIVPHAFYYSIRDERRHERPPDAGPNNIFWPEYYRFSRYIKRMSWLMTEGVNQAQIAVLTHEVNIPWKCVKPLFEQQLEFNYLEESLLASCRIENGMICIAKQQYKAVVLESVSGWNAETMAFLERFAAAGGTVIYVDDADEEAMEAIGTAAGVRVSDVDQLPDVLRSVIDPVPSVHPANPDIRLSHLQLGGREVIVLVNEGEQAGAGTLQLPFKGKAEAWKPWNGTIEPVSAAVGEDGMTVSFALERRECLWIVVDPKEEAKSIQVPSLQLVYTHEIAGEWEVSGACGNRKLVSLSSWTEWEGMQHVSGTVIYEKEFELDHLDFDEVVLDLGEVHEMARIEVNGVRHEDVKLWAPYAFSIDGLLRQGRNRVRIEVTNSLANQYDQASVKSGLIGPVKVHGYKKMPGSAAWHHE